MASASHYLRFTDLQIYSVFGWNGSSYHPTLEFVSSCCEAERQFIKSFKKNSLLLLVLLAKELSESQCGSVWALKSRRFVSFTRLFFQFQVF